VRSKTLVGRLSEHAAIERARRLRVAEQVDAIAEDMDAQYILTSHYVLTSELTFYARSAKPVIEYNERVRWLAFGDPQASLFEQRGLYVVEAERDVSSELSRRFQEFTKIATIARTRGGGIITNYVVYLVAKPTRGILD
jgi:hypothetical protein